MAGFGLIFHDFLKSLGDETSGAAVTNGLFNTVSFFMGETGFSASKYEINQTHFRNRGEHTIIQDVV